MEPRAALLPFGYLKTARARLFVLVILVILPALAVQVYGAWSDLQQSLAERREVSQRAAEQARGEFSDLLDETRAVFTDLVRVPQMRAADNCIQVFTSLRFAYERLAPNVTNLGLAEANGEIYCAVNPVQGGNNIASQPDFIAASQSLDLALGLYTPNPVVGSPLVSVSYPILSFDGRVQTIIFATFDTRWLETWQDKAALPEGAALTLLSTDGRPLWRTVSGENVLLNGEPAEAEPFYAPQAGAAPSESPDLDGVIRLNITLPLSLGEKSAGFLHLGYPVAELYTQAYGELYWKLGLLGLVSSAAMILAWWGSETMFLQPLNNLLAAVARVQTGDLGARAGMVGGLGELTALAQSFDAMTDALQRREAEQRQLEERFRAAFESSAIGMGLMTLDGNILAVNAAVVEMSGYSEAELRQRNDRENVYPPDAEAGMDLFAEMLAGQRASYSVERRYLRKYGEVFWTRLTLSLVRDADGQPAYLVGQIEDIDEQKRKAAALAESEARFRAMFENAAVGVSLMTLDRHIVQINPKVTAITGYTPDEMYAINPSDMVLEPDRFLDRDLFIELVEGKRDQYIMEKRYIRKDGSIFWGRVNFALVRNEKEQPLYIVGIIEEITDEKEAARSLAESEARFRTLYAAAEMGIVLIDLGNDGNQPLDENRFDQLVANQQLNPAMQRMFGYTAEELARISIAEMIHPDDLGIDRHQFRQLLTGEIDSFHSEKRFVRKDGSVFWGRLTDSLARTADGSPRMVIGIIEDITEERLSAERLAAQEAEHRQQLEQRIAERTEELNQANERLREKAAQDAVTAERTRLARDLHDAVTQTLFSTTLIADVLPEIWAQNPNEGKRRLEEVRQLTRGALAEMRTLLVELRPNALVEAPLPTLLRQLTEALSGRSRISIQISAEGERKLPPDVQVGLYRLAQEALNNVVKHAKASQAVVTLRYHDESVRMTVADNGAGFDPSAVTADHLGLKIMRERAEAIGAKLGIYSEPGEGTQVSVVWEAGKQVDR